MLISEPSDTELITEVLNGDTDSFSVLVIRHQQKVLGFCLSMLSNRQAAEDAAQEIFVKAFTAMPGFRRGSSFSTWLYRIAFNHCCNLRRKTCRARQESFDAMTEAAREKAMRAAAPEAAPHEDPEIAAGAMAALPAAYRAVVALRLEGENYAEIAVALGVSMDSVKAKLRRARVILRARLRHVLPEQVSKHTERE
ncbi:MAG: RNA polymerase sigma factor [Elusimicrobia bacterium]|nr:RNA polymerase sigma factor [Elusimicrobiota bacterium]